LRIKPALAYLEVHLVDHCNLNCKGCGHFSPIADEWFADPDRFARDMRQLNRLFSNIRMIRLMGGEPLLHPEIERFLFNSRDCFPKADVRIVTNGVLISQMPDSFWEACRTYSVGFDITVYPPLKHRIAFFKEFAQSKGVRLRTLKTAESFYVFYNKKGNSDAKLSFKRCRPGWNAVPNLRNGRLYSCPIPTYVHYFNRRFGTRIPSDGYVSIYSSNLSGWDVKKALGRGPSTCRYCTYGWTKVPRISWSPSNRAITDWEPNRIPAQDA
jgi:organic radical activating enzyme